MRGDTLELVPASEDTVTRIEFFGDEVERITETDALTGEFAGARAKRSTSTPLHTS